VRTMETTLLSVPLEQVEADALVVMAFEAGEGEPAPAPDLAGGWIQDLFKTGEFKGKALETALLHRPRA